MSASITGISQPHAYVMRSAQKFRSAIAHVRFGQKQLLPFALVAGFDVYYIVTPNRPDHFAILIKKVDLRCTIASTDTAKTAVSTPL
jgi:hypothetical protein